MKRSVLAIILILSISMFSGCISSDSSAPETTLSPTTTQAPTTTLPPTTTPAPTTQPPTTEPPLPSYLVEEDGDGLLDGLDVSILASHEGEVEFIEERGIKHFSKKDAAYVCLGEHGIYGSFVYENLERPVIATLFDDCLVDDGFERWLFDQLYENQNLVHDFNLLTEEKLGLLELIYQTASSKASAGFSDPASAMRTICQGVLGHYFEYYEGYTRAMQLRNTNEEECPVALYLRGGLVRLVEKEGEIVPQVYFVDLTVDTDSLFDKYMYDEDNMDINDMIREYYLPNYKNTDIVKDDVYTNYINSIEGISTGIAWENRWFDCSLVQKDDIEYVGNEFDSVIKAKLNSGIYMKIDDFIDTKVYDEFEIGITKDNSEIYIGSNYYKMEDFNYDSNFFLHTSYENFESTEKAVHDDEIFFDENNQLRIAMRMSPLLDKPINFSKKILSHYLSDFRYEFYASLETLHSLLYG